MAEREQLTVAELTLTGHTEQASAVKVLIRDAAGNALLAVSETSPSASAGYAKGCLYIDSNASSGSILFVNRGNATTASWSTGIA